MKTNYHDAQERLWRGDPLPEELLVLLDRPSDAARQAVYAAARAAVADVPATHGATVWQWLAGRGRISYATWALCASMMLAVCVWTGNAGRSTAVNDGADVVAMAGDFDRMARTATVSGQDAVDIDDMVFAVEVKSVEQSLALLADDLEYEL